MDFPEGVPSWEGDDPWLCYGCLRGPFTPALFLNELDRSSELVIPTSYPFRNLWTKSLPDGSWSFAGSSSSGGASVPVSSCLHSVLKEGCDLKPNYVS